LCEDSRALTLDNELRLAGSDADPKYERLAEAIERAIVGGRLESGERLPAIRALSRQLDVSAATVVAAYTLLRDRGLVSGHVGRGTYVVPRVPPAPPASSRGPLLHPAFQPWRKRALFLSEARLRADHPDAIDCARGRPDSRLMPLGPLRRAWHEAIEGSGPEDLQYPVRDAPLPELVAHLIPRLERDGISGHAQQLVVATSAQQFVSLAIHAFVSASAAAEPLVVVEEPGHHSAMDALERAGCRLVGAAVDGEGVRPEALEAALSTGARMALFTPRAHSPTGASWTPRRRMELAAVLARFPDVFVVEDDHFGELAGAPCGSLLNDAAIGDRVLYVRSFSKAIAPDLRLAVGVCGERVVETIREAKYFADGWTSHIAQRVVARLLADPEVDAALEAARATYARRRSTLVAAVEAGIGGSGSSSGSTSGWCAPGRDGLHVWIGLPRGCDSSEVLARAAGLGVLAATGEPFFVKPGNGGAIRVNAGAARDAQARIAGEILGRAIRETAITASVPITV
jgi:DNA-binding transcriptional MocR family regulator